jgi:hypothetical protein
MERNGSYGSEPVTDGKPSVNPPHLPVEKMKSNEVLEYINVANRMHNKRGWKRNERQKKNKEGKEKKEERG